MCAECVSVSLSHWTHIFHRADESDVCTCSICTLTVHVPPWPQRHSPRSEIITLLCAVCLIMWPQACVSPSLCVSGGESVALCAHVSENGSKNIWPNKHAKTLKNSEKKSMSRVKVSHAAHLTISLSSCSFLAVTGDVSLLSVLCLCLTCSILG